MIETRNFIPEAFLIHQFHESDTTPAMRSLSMASGTPVMQSLFPSVADPRISTEVSYLSDDEDEDEDWEDEDEDWDEDDEDWDEDDEDWDEDDEEWDDEDEDFDEDEDWSEDTEE
jgi:hypothetical protein